MTVKRFIVRLSRTVRGTSEYALSEPWYMFLLGLLIGMGLIAVYDRQDLEHLRKLTTSWVEQRVVAQPAPAPVVTQPTKTEVCVDRLLDATVKPTRTYYPLGGDATFQWLSQQKKEQERVKQLDDLYLEITYPGQSDTEIPAPPKKPGKKSSATQWQRLILGMFAEPK